MGQGTTVYSSRDIYYTKAILVYESCTTRSNKILWTSYGYVINYVVSKIKIDVHCMQYNEKVILYFSPRLARAKSHHNGILRLGY